MPIQGLSDRGSVDPRFKEIGRIRKGASKSGNRPGADLDHFRYVPDSGHQESAAVFERLYGKEPKSLEVFFPFNEMERVFSSWREAYGQNRLCKLRCDGARWHDWVDGDRHYHSAQGRECELKERDTENRCPNCPLAYSGRLSVILRPMWENGQIGLITVLTSSINDIGYLSGKLVTYEPLAGKPFTLWRETERIGVPIQGKRAGKDSDLLHLELSEERLLLEFEAARRQSIAMIAASIQPDPESYGEAEFEDAPTDYDEAIVEGDPFLNGTPAEPESAPPAHQWTLAEADALFKWTRNTLVITDAHVLASLGVEKLSEYAGDTEQARTRIEAWVAEQSKAPAAA